MGSNKSNQAYFEEIAEESLSTFAQVAEAANAQLTNALARPPSPIANNTFTNPAASNTQRQILQDKIESFQKLVREPALARVAVRDEDKKKTTFYICRATPVSINNKDLKLASYLSPIGRLAALPVGADCYIHRDGVSLSAEIVEHARYQPTLTNNEWDSRDSVLDGQDYGRFTIESLRALLKRGVADGVDTALLDQLLAEETEITNIREGVRRNILTKMGLRDQPILDQYQDDIFRLPLNSRLLLLGAPGTGKTTTLIRRLRQKLDMAFLEDDEKRAIQNATSKDDPDHVQNWIMFTPTELLRLYVKEAFNREGVAAPDDCISTWADFRDDLARNQFGILRAATGAGSFVLKPGAGILLPNILTEQIAWFSDFDQWQKATFWDDIRTSARTLSKNPAVNVAALGKRILFLVDQSGTTPQPAVFETLSSIVSEIQSLVTDMKEASDRRIRGALNLQVNRNKGFLEEVSTFIDTLAVVGDEPDDHELDDDEDADQTRTGRAAAVAQYMQAVRAQARGQARKRPIGKSSRTGRLLEFLGERTLSEKDLAEVGESLLVQSALRWFVNPARRYIDKIPAQYRRFRRLRQGEGRWYRADGLSGSDIHPLELDLLLLGMIKSTDELMTSARNLFDATNPAYPTLQRLQRLYRTQVLVDEATDFSPLQLASMATLARPGIRSFFACGDFNQRVTLWGTRTVDEIKWVLPDIATRTISVAYRQSRQLHELAKQIVLLSDAKAPDVALPDYVDNEGVAPVLAKNLVGVPAVAAWLGQRIVEIEKFSQQLPSIAVLVNSEEEVLSVATALNHSLTEQNIRAVPCPNGQVRGRDNDVRVFDVQHIKGLEFEAVFFIGVDELARRQPDLCDKYLYVGATRAATYLGMTAETTLPGKMAALERLFSYSWS